MRHDRPSRSPFLSLRMDGQRRTLNEQARGRLIILSALFALGFLFVALRVADLSILQGIVMRVMKPVGEQTATPSKTVNMAPIARRGSIYDRNGVLLATTLPVVSLYADPAIMMDVKKTIAFLERLFPDLSAKDLTSQLNGDRRFVWIQRGITPEQQAAILDHGDPGLGFRTEYRRFYPHGSLAAHIVGYTNIDGQGLSGEERHLNDRLSRGQDVTLAIDGRIQYAVNEAIKNTIKEFKAIGGVGVVMDVNSGEVLSAVSLPDFDPHRPGDGSDQHKFNRFSLGVYEPGSLFKIFSTAAALEKGTVSLQSRFDVRTPVTAGRFTIRDFHPENRILTLPEVFMHSSNIGTAHIAQKLGTDGLKEFYRQYGFLHPITADVSDKATPLIPRPWREVNTLTASYGHGIAVSPLHIIAATATTINGGFLTPPRFEKVTQPDSPVRTQIISADTSALMQAMLRLVVREGTGKKADVPGFEVGGKTGTSEKNINGRYQKDRRIASFVGVYPMHKPRYAVLVMIDEPKATKATFGYATGGWVAAPAVRQIITQMTRILMEPPVSTTHIDHAESLMRYLLLPQEVKTIPKNPPATAHVTPASTAAPSPISSPPPVPDLSRDDHASFPDDV